MRKIFALAGAAMLAGSMSAWAADPVATTGKTAETADHSTEHMTQGMHMMSKQNHMSNKAMPARSPNCTEEAIAKMPADHRAALDRTEFLPEILSLARRGSRAWRY